MASSISRVGTWSTTIIPCPYALTSERKLLNICPDLYCGDSGFKQFAITRCASSTTTRWRHLLELKSTLPVSDSAIRYSKRNWSNKDMMKALSWSSPAYERLTTTGEPNSSSHVISLSSHAFLSSFQVFPLSFSLLSNSFFHPYFRLWKRVRNAAEMF